MESTHKYSIHSVIIMTSAINEISFLTSLREWSSIIGTRLGFLNAQLTPISYLQHECDLRRCQLARTIRTFRSNERRSRRDRMHSYRIHSPIDGSRETNEVNETHNWFPRQFANVIKKLPITQAPALPIVAQWNVTHVRHTSHPSYAALQFATKLRPLNVISCKICI